jgi:hypothetical protein
MPFAMCASTGFVPQWYMKTPGSPALKLNVNDLPGMMSTKSLFGATRAAWKSTECGIGEWFVRVTCTVCPSRAWMTGPGTPPSNVQASYLIPGAIERTRWLIPMLTCTTGPGVVAGSAAGYALCAAASASALAGAMPAKLWLACAPSAEAGIDIPGIVVAAAGAAFAAARASSRAFWAETPIQTATIASTATPIPRKSANSLKPTSRSSSR